MKYILDTTVVSAIMRSEPEPSRRLAATAPEDVAIPQPVVAEILYGLERLPRSRRRRELERRLVEVLRNVERAPWDDRVSECFGHAKMQLERRGARVDDFDVAIAAHALAFSATLVTRNVRHFERIPSLSVENWG